MSEWEKAREAAARKLCEFVGLHADDENGGVTVWQREAEALDAALSAFEKAGYVLVPITISEAMVRAATDIGITDPDGWETCAYEVEQLWPLIITAALKDRA